MFAPMVQPHINPFAAGCFGRCPRMDFYMNLACATMFPPPMPMTYGGFGYYNPFMSGRSYGMPFLGYTTQNYGYNYRTPIFNYPPAPGYNTYSSNPFTFNAIGSMNAGNSFVYNPSAIALPTNFSIPNFNIRRTSTNTNNSSSSNSSSTTVTSNVSSNVSKTGQKLRLNNSQYGPKFLEKVKQISQRLNCDYRDLLAIMNSESGINAQCVASNGATGLIMFMPQYFDTKKIVKMSPMEQLDLVEKTIMAAKKRAGLGNKRLSAGQLYTLVFLPARANRQVLTTAGEKFYNCNKALDANKDGKITQDEMAVRISKKYVSDSSFYA